MGKLKDLVKKRGKKASSSDKKLSGRILKWYSEMSKTKRYYLSSVIFLILAAWFLTWFIEYRYFINDMWRAWDFVVNWSPAFYFNVLIVFTVLLALWAIINRPLAVFAFVWVIENILGYVHVNKFNTRGYPLLPEDFQLAEQAGSLVKFVNIGGIVRIILSCVLMIVVVVLFAHFFEKKLNLRNPKTSDSFFKKHLIASRMLILVVAITSFMYATEFARHNSGEKYEETPMGTYFTAWNQNRNYDENGCIVGFLYNLQKLSLNAPNGYNKEYIESVAQKYTLVAEEKNQERIDPSKEKINFVVILNESFYDPSVEFQGVKFTDYYPYTGGDITPNLHQIQQKYPSGKMYSIDYGGGTANIEFETLTGYSNYWLASVPYTAIIPKLKSVPSIASDLKEYGYNTTAIHPFNGGMYKRNISLKKEGINEFITESEMTYTEHDGESEYINDKSAFNELLKNLKESGDRQFTALITMQNHTPYNYWNYEENKFKLIRDDVDDETRSQIETYYQTLHSSDNYLGEFINSLDKMDEKVVVLFFGDHSAGLFEDLINSDKKELVDLAHVTPYFLYANFDLGTENLNLPTTTPNCMVNTALNVLDWQKSPKYYLLDDVCSEAPILAPTYYEDGAPETEILKEYELTIYDILGGERYWLE